MSPYKALIINLIILFTVVFGVSYILSYFKLPYYLNIIIFGITVAGIALLANRYVTGRNKRRMYHISTQIYSSQGRPLSPEERQTMELKLMYELEKERRNASISQYDDLEFLKRELVLAGLYIKYHKYDEARDVINSVEKYVIASKREELIAFLNGLKRELDFYSSSSHSA